MSRSASSPVLLEIQLRQLEARLGILLIQSHRLAQLGQRAVGAALTQVNPRQHRVHEGRALAQRHGPLARVQSLPEAVFFQANQGQVRVGHSPVGLQLNGAAQVVHG